MSAPEINPELERALLEALEAERAWVAQLLHDTLCQSFAGLPLLVKMVERASPGASGKLWLELNECLQMAGADLRCVVDALRAEELEPGGLIEALEDLVAKARLFVRCQFTSSGDFSTLAEPLAKGLLAIGHEVISGAIRARAIDPLAMTLKRVAGVIRFSLEEVPTTGVRWDWVELQARVLGAEFERAAGTIRISVAG